MLAYKSHSLGNFKLYTEYDAGWCGPAILAIFFEATLFASRRFVGMISKKL